ncbi:hypothetical protein GA0115253_109637 [Streptomyces sp. Termitarium-T10T-6]|nr:hypothetical protein GA0115253_109637 [Streptomyces sp. Termitarium-T10T-6]
MVSVIRVTVRGGPDDPGFPGLPCGRDPLTGGSYAPFRRSEHVPVGRPRRGRLGRSRRPGDLGSDHHAAPRAAQVPRGGGARGSGVECRRGRVGRRDRGAAQGRQRRGRGRGHSGGARCDGALFGGHRRRWLLRPLRRQDTPGADHRRPRDRPAQRGRLPVPGERQADPVRGGGDQRPRRRHARHPGHLGAGTGRVGQQVPAYAAETGRTPGPGRLRRGRHLPLADGLQPGPVRRLPGLREALPAGR